MPRSKNKSEYPMLQLTVHHTPGTYIRQEM